jgi:hypothetical protein
MGVSWKAPWYSAKRIFLNIPWGLNKGMLTNTQGQSDIVNSPRIISETKYTSANRLFFYINNNLENGVQDNEDWCYDYCSAMQ